MTPMEPAVALPDHVAGWTREGDELTYDARGLFTYMDGGAELYLAYGVQQLRVRKFARPNQPPITLELYRLASAADAYGVFSFERQDDSQGIGQGSEFGGGLLRFWKGPHFVRVYADGEGADLDAALLALGRATADAIRESGAEPTLVGALPGQDFGLVEKSVRYLRSHVLLNQRLFLAHENILNLTPKTEAVLAQYARAEQTVHLLLVRYPSAEGSGEAAASFVRSYHPDSGDIDVVKRESQKGTLVRQRGTLLLIVLGAPTVTDAEVLLKATEGKLFRRRSPETKD